MQNPEILVLLFSNSSGSPPRGLGIVIVYQKSKIVGVLRVKFQPTQKWGYKWVGWELVFLVSKRLSRKYIQYFTGLSSSFTSQKPEIFSILKFWTGRKEKKPQKKIYTWMTLRRSSTYLFCIWKHHKNYKKKILVRKYYLYAEHILMNVFTYEILWGFHKQKTISHT